MTDIVENNRKQWERIHKILKNRLTTAVIWIVCNDYFYRRDLMERFKEEFDSFKHFTVSLKDFHEKNLESFFNKKLPGDLFNQKSIRTIVHMTEIESQIPLHFEKEKGKKSFFDILNFEREIIFEKFPFHFVFWSETYSQIETQRFAPDFWDWVVYKVEFQAPAGYSKSLNEKPETEMIEEIKPGRIENEDTVYNRIARNLELLDKTDKNQITDRLTILKNIISDYYNIGEYLKAKEAIEEVLKLKKIHKKEKAFLYGTAGNIYSKLNMHEKALEKYKEALKIYRKLAKENPKTFLPDVAMTLNNLANLYSVRNEFSQALEKYEEALKIRREFAKENPGTYLPEVAATLNNLAILQKDRNEFPQASEKYEEALKIYRELAKENPGTYLPEVAATLNNFAILQKNRNKLPQALEKYEEALKIRRKLAIENPRTYLHYLADTLNNLSVLHSYRNEFPQALEKYKEALKIYRELAKENPKTYLPYVAGTLNNLANLHSNKNEFAQALEKHEAALKIYRELAKENPETYLPDVAMILNNLGELYRVTNNLQQAETTLKEALKIRRELAKENPKTYLPVLAETLINLSILYGKSLHDKEKSVAYALEAIEILSPLYKKIPYLEDYLKTAIQILQGNGIGIDKLLKEKQK